MGKVDTKPQIVADLKRHDDDRRPVMIVAVGRQRVGKTTLLNVLTEVYRQRGATLYDIP